MSQLKNQLRLMIPRLAVKLLAHLQSHFAKWVDGYNNRGKLTLAYL